MASVVQIIYIQALSSYTNLLNSIWRIVVCGQVVQVSSIMTAIIPFLKPFLTSLESGFISASTASHVLTSGNDTTGQTRHPSSYIKLASSHVRGRHETRDKHGEIWIKMDYMVKRESNQAHIATSPDDKSWVYSMVGKLPPPFYSQLCILFLPDVFEARLAARESSSRQQSWNPHNAFCATSIDARQYFSNTLLGLAHVYIHLLPRRVLSSFAGWQGPVPPYFSSDVRRLYALLIFKEREFRARVYNWRHMGQEQANFRIW